MRTILGLLAPALDKEDIRFTSSFHCTPHICSLSRAHVIYVKISLFASIAPPTPAKPRHEDPDRAHIGASLRAPARRCCSPGTPREPGSWRPFLEGTAFRSCAVCQGPRLLVQGAFPRLV